MFLCLYNMIGKNYSFQMIIYFSLQQIINLPLVSQSIMMDKKRICYQIISIFTFNTFTYMSHLLTPHPHNLPLSLHIYPPSLLQGETMEENANLVVRLLIRRPECLGPALRGEGGGLLRATQDGIILSLQVLFSLLNYIISIYLVHSISIIWLIMLSIILVWLKCCIRILS